MKGGGGRYEIMKKGPSDWVLCWLALLLSHRNIFTLTAETVEEGKREGMIIVCVINKAAWEGLCFLYADLKVTAIIAQCQVKLVQAQ